MLSVMGPMRMMLMRKLFRRTNRYRRLKDRKGDKFRLYHGYNKLIQETKENSRHKYAFKRNCLPKTIVAFEPIQNLEVTSVYIDIITSSETQLDIRDIIVEVANIIDEASNCLVKLLDDNRSVERNDLTLRCTKSRGD